MSDASQPKPPVVDAETLREVAPGVFVIPDHRVPLVPNIGIVLGRDTALVVDCGMGPANGERVLRAAKKLAGAAMTSFTTKCKKDAQASCDMQAADKKLNGAAKTSFTKKCVSDAT